MSWAWGGLALLVLLALWLRQRLRLRGGRLHRSGAAARRSTLGNTSAMATDGVDGPDFPPTEPLTQPPAQLPPQQATLQATQHGGLPAHQPSVEPETASHPATRPCLGRYRIDRPLGQGAMGAVYQGHDPVTGQRVALKTMALSREFSGHELDDARSRFLREAEMAGRLHHPDIVGILDAGESDGLAYIAMELVEGIDLSHHVRPAQLLAPRQVLDILARVAEALAYAHSQGVTHRDIKPANIMVNMAQDVVKVMDFGVARVADATRTRTGVVLGTPSFMSPEQLSGQPIDGRSDLYSLGVTMFLLLTGKLPYPNDSMAALMRAIGREPPLALCSERPDLPEALGDIVALALQKHPSTRYASGQHMAADLRAVLRSLPA